MREESFLKRRTGKTLFGSFFEMIIKIPCKNFGVPDKYLTMEGINIKELVFTYRLALQKQQKING